MEERKERTWKGAVKYLKVAAASTLMASIGSAYTFDTVYADTNGVNNNVKIEEIFNQTILSNAPFKDVQADFWAADSIRWAISYGVIKGDVNGFFRPNDVITEAEFAEMIGHFYKSLEKEITDVATKEKISWQDATYKVLAKYRVPLMGYKDAFYRKSPLTKGLLAQVLAYTNGQKSDLDHAIYYVLDKGIVVGKSETGKTIYEKFGHKDHLTRAQTIVVLHRLYNTGNRDLASSVIKGKVEDVNKEIQLAEAQVNKEVVEKKEGVHVVPVSQPKVESAQVKATSTAKKVVTSKTSSKKLVTPKKPLTVKKAPASVKKPTKTVKKPTTTVKKPTTNKKPLVIRSEVKNAAYYDQKVGDIYRNAGVSFKALDTGFGGYSRDGVVNQYSERERQMVVGRGDKSYKLAALAMERLGYGDSDAIYKALVKVGTDPNPRPIKVGNLTIENTGSFLGIFW
ncbi:S-layer homology domain-containing protein [Geobacillus sp. FSL W8-0032]|uniref:S-layer homology domain-containing protein n=1 Tax=unclassified Geobacillus TaxID=2642459 RepID=UPI0030D866D8